MRLNTGPLLRDEHLFPPADRTAPPVRTMKKILPSAGARFVPQPIDAQAFRAQPVRPAPPRCFRRIPGIPLPMHPFPARKNRSSLPAARNTARSQRYIFCSSSLCLPVLHQAHTVPIFPRDAKEAGAHDRPRHILQRIISKALPASGGQMCRSV